MVYKIIFIPEFFKISNKFLSIYFLFTCQQNTFFINSYFLDG